MAKIPAEIGKYVIKEEVAKGGMGAVYKAVHPTLKRFVVLKKLTLRGNASITERFKREARIMMDFRNDRIVQVYDHFKEGSSYYIVQEFVDGLSLDKLIKQERYLPSDVALLIFRDCCRALKYAHDKNVVHRDIKPANILISKTGEVKLVDFGIAVSGEDTDAGLTRDGMTLGTPSYMAPEQFENSKTVDLRADIYSLGVMLYESATGKKPYPGTFSAEAIAMIQKGKYVPVKRANPKADRAITALVAKAMHFKAQRRYQDLSRAIVELDRYFNRTSASNARKRLKSLMAGESIKEIAPVKKKRPAVFIAAGIATVIALSGIGYLGYSRGLYHETLAPGKYGALVFSARIKKGFKTPEETYIHASIFQDDGVDIPQVEKRYVFRPNKLLETENFFTLETGKIYLAPGHYRVKLNVENEVYWDTFYLHPRKHQRDDASTADGRLVQVTLDSFPVLPLTAEFAVTDAVSGADIKSSTRITVQSGGRWVPWGGITALSLKTGAVQKFKFERIGYHTREYSLLVAPFQTVLEIAVSLIPLEATVTFTGDTNGVKILVNGETEYLSGGTQGKLTDVPSIEDETAQLILAPGEYLITAKRGGDGADIALFVTPNSTNTLNILYDRDEKNLTIAPVRR